MPNVHTEDGMPRNAPEPAPLIEVNCEQLF